MNLEARVKVLENMYIHVLVDSICNYNKQGVLDKVIEDKRNIQMFMGKQQAEQLGITKPEDVFMVLSQFFNCASWEITQLDKGFEAKAKACRLCAHAKKLGSESPCYIYCLNPMEGMVRGINPKINFKVVDTLWEGNACRVEVTY